MGRENGPSPEEMGIIPEEAKSENFTDESEPDFVDKTRGLTQSIVNESRLPTENTLGYESTVGFYGGKLIVDDESRLVWNTSGVISRADRTGDPALRSMDEHVIRDPGKMKELHPEAYKERKKIFNNAKRYRGKKEEIAEHISELGLDEYYGLHKDGIEIKKPELFTEGRALQDIYRADIVEGGDLKEIDRFEALGKSAAYIREMHDEYGGIGELLPSDIIFEERTQEGVEKPVLSIPDIVYNPEKRIGEKEKKATDLLDFLASIGIEEVRRTDWEQVDRALDTILEHYDKAEIISLTESFIKRGRLNLKDGALSNYSTIRQKIVDVHNVARLGTNTIESKTEGDVKSRLAEAIISACERYKVKHNKDAEGGDDQAPLEDALEDEPQTSDMPLKQESSKNEKERQWESLVEQVDTMHDNLGEPVDDGIKESVTALLANEFPTSQSCEGHMDHGLKYPWVDIYAPEPEGWEENEEKQRQWSESNNKERERIEKLLEEFYAEREVDDDVRLSLEDKGMFGAFRLQSAGGESMNNLSDAEQLVRQRVYREEMQNFSRFLKRKFLEAQ